MTEQMPEGCEARVQPGSGDRAGHLYRPGGDPFGSKPRALFPGCDAIDEAPRESVFPFLPSGPPIQRLTEGRMQKGPLQPVFRPHIVLFCAGGQEDGRVSKPPGGSR